MSSRNYAISINIQMTTTPTYILILFVAISIGLVYMIAHWFFGNMNSGEEGFENNKYKYIPDANAPNSVITFGIADLAVDISSACGFIKVDSQLIKKTPTSGTDPASTTAPPTADEEYTVPYSQLQLYKLYNDATGYSTATNANIYAKMDLIYGPLFDSSQLGSLSDENIDKTWETNQSSVINDALYKGFDYFVVQSESSNRTCDQGLSSFFLQLIKKNKSSSSTLLSLKNAYYSIIKPRFLANTLSNMYWKNVKTITNDDKGTNNSIIFALNTFGAIANTSTLLTDLSENNVAQIISNTTSVTPFTIDSILGYHSLSVAFELYRYVKYFEGHGEDTSGDKKPAIKTTYDRFISGYPQYLSKVNQIAPDSPLVFTLRNKLNDKPCPVLSKILPVIDSIDK